MYKPFGTNIHNYDVNSLYPNEMIKQMMPVGNPTFFEGDITKILDKPFGFFEVYVNVPDDINHPIIQTKVKTSSGLRTISPKGFWKTWLFSSEIG